MTQPFPLQPTNAISGAQAPAARPKADPSAAPAFKALLDELEQRAHSLELESTKDLSRDDLAGAVDNARISLQQLLSLKDQVLEAWQASQLQHEAASGGNDG